MVTVKRSSQVGSCLYSLSLAGILGLEPRAICTQGKHFHTEPHAQPLDWQFQTLNLPQTYVPIDILLYPLSLTQETQKLKSL